MVLCDYLYNTNEYAIYKYGSSTIDITGDICFYLDGSRYKILRTPSKSIVYERSIRMLYLKYIDRFKIRLFNEKISLES